MGALHDQADVVGQGDRRPGGIDVAFGCARPVAQHPCPVCPVVEGLGEGLGPPLAPARGRRVGARCRRARRAPHGARRGGRSRCRAPRRPRAARAAASASPSRRLEGARPQGPTLGAVAASGTSRSAAGLGARRSRPGRRGWRGRRCAERDRCLGRPGRRAQPAGEPECIVPPTLVEADDRGHDVEGLAQCGAAEGVARSASPRQMAAASSANPLVAR